MPHLKRLAPVLAVLLLSVPHPQQANSADFTDLLSRLPSSANAIMVVDVNEVHRSPIAVREGWKDKHEAAYVKKPLMLPPESDRIVIASQLDPTAGYRQRWEVAVMSLTEPVSTRAIARAEGGYIDTINNLKSVWTPSDAYFVQFATRVMGVMSPANRQAVSRWAASGRIGKKVEISDYLRTAASSVRGTTQIAIAVDLKDALQPHVVREALAKSPLVKGNLAKQRQWEKILTSLKGITLKIHLGKTATGTFQVDFGENPEPFGKNAREVALRILRKTYPGADDIANWKMTLHSTAIVLEGKLTTSNMRRAFSLLEIPTTKFSSLKDQKPTDDKATKAKASQAYFKSVNALIDDLRKTLKDRSKRDFYPVWYERFGRRIDRLPILNVDEKLLAWGASVSATFRGISSKTRSSNVNASVAQSQIYGNYNYSYDGYGYYRDNNTIQSARQAAGAQVRAQATTYKFQSWKQIEDSIPKIRQMMTKKYNVSF